MYPNICDVSIILSLFIYMNNSISDWNLINYEKNALEKIIEKVENNEKINNKILEKLENLEMKVDNILNKINTKSKNDLNQNDNKEKNIDLGLKILANDEIIRMRNNAWRQNKIKLPGIFNNSYITTPNIPLDKNFRNKFAQ